MPKIIYGTAWKKDRTADLVYAALKAGFRAIDTACQPKHYREDLVGVGVQRALADGLSRDDLYLQTKFTSVDGQDRTQPLPYDDTAPVATQVAQSVARSLSNLGVEALDAVLLHSPLRTRAATLEAYAALEAERAAGRVGRLGVSNVGADELRWLLGRVSVNVVQNRWYEGNGWDWEVYDLCRSEGIEYQAFWTLTGSPGLLASRPVRALAARQGCTPQQVVYRLCQLWNITPLCGTTNEAHMREALEVEGLFGDEPEVAVLYKAMRGET
ncbi:hypothetical protein CspeluHIS016_0113560 [Cutaneotrichosporon spelunceum]|uniref:NADP-dependent oxidoreductase domain-containing protein n=1 Tax=Cutaneotrichosporon spelunceum TaxID=1672016 RepID=A0AAD3Y995_9TREE|nr:hypothetical protein CspeluHIS016_0113560 [Cutaneotrichosporon spelunceum]